MMTRQLHALPVRFFVAIMLAVATGAVLFAPSTIRAEFIGNLVSIDVSNNQGSGRATFHFMPFSGHVPARVVWRLNQVFKIRGPGNAVLGTIEKLEVELQGDPSVDIDFAVSAGDFDTTFDIQSATIAFSPLQDPLALASAGVTLTDGAPLPGDGASIDPLPPENKLFEARYNGGTVFAKLLDPQSLLAGGTTNTSDDSGVQTISGSVGSIETSYRFKLSAKDSASGTSNFVVVPEPCSLVLAVTGLLVSLAFARCCRCRTTGELQ